MGAACVPDASTRAVRMVGTVSFISAVMGVGESLRVNGDQRTGVGSNGAGGGPQRLARRPLHIQARRPARGRMPSLRASCIEFLFKL